jgi:heme A synthase
MSETPDTLPTGAMSHRVLLLLSNLGALLALAILGASVLLRLNTVFAPDGHTLTTLPVAWEQATRLLHRLAASAVALLALGAIVLCWMRRHSGANCTKPTALIVLATLVLAVIGPLTPGYRASAVTIVNVATGLLLLMSFWWLRESLARPTQPRRRLDGFVWAALAALLLHVASGAAASFYEMHALRWPAFVHLASFALCLIVFGVVLREQRGDASVRRCGTLLAGLFTGQALLGYVLMWQESRNVGLSFLHAMVSPLVALALVSLAVRSAAAKIR